MSNFADQQINEIFIEALGARQIAECPGPNKGQVLQFYSVSGHVVIVQKYGDNNGWTHYLPSKKLGIAESIEEIKQWVEK